LAVEVLLLQGHTPELLGTGAGIVARLLQQLGLAVAVGGKDYARVNEVILHTVFIFPVSTVANIYGGYPNIAGKDSDKLVIGVNEVATVIGYAGRGGFLGGNGFAELGAGGGVGVLK
jgi:hypothetical protein